MKDILCIGSCRSSTLPSNKYKIHNFTYTHSTKEIIQLLKFAFVYDIEAQNKIVNKENILVDITIQKFKKIKELCKLCNIFLLEISSIKEIKDDNGYYYNQWVVRDNKIKTTITTNIATVEDVKNDINIIKELLLGKIIIFQSHFNLDFEGMSSLNFCKLIPPIQSRNVIDTAIEESSGILKLIPRKVFMKYDWKLIMSGENDTCHLNKYGQEILALALDDIIII